MATMKSQRSVDQLLLDNYSYEISSHNKSSKLWYCTKYRTIKCPVSVKTNLEGTDVIHQRGVHNFVPVWRIDEAFEIITQSLHHLISTESLTDL